MILDFILNEEETDASYIVYDSEFNVIIEMKLFRISRAKKQRNCDVEFRCGWIIEATAMRYDKRKLLLKGVKLNFIKYL